MSKKVEKKASGMMIAHVLTVAWMIFIFYMSAQPGETSGEISGSVSHLFMQIWNVVFFCGWSEAEILHMAEIWDYPIRKLAHMTEFGILAMLLVWVLGYYTRFRCWVIRRWRVTLNMRYVTALAIAVLYAATDEIHQLFVPDRAGMFSDVLVDTSGVLLALVFVYLIEMLWACCKKRQK